MGEQREKVWPELVLALVLAGTTLAVIVLTWTGLWAGFSLYAVSDEARTERSALLTAAFVVGTAVPLVCAVIAYARDLRALFVLNLVLLLLTLMVGAVTTLRSARNAPPPEYPSVTRCQVHSGGDNTCPGG
jgi:undecaprenyl pyrophosphate phosphatase UppP